MGKPLKIVSIGAAVQDVLLEGKIFTPQHEKTGDVAEFSMGSKNEFEKVTFSTGGGATNAAVTFARQGLDSHYLGRIGRDIAGRAVLDNLHDEDVDTSLVYYAEDEGTGYSIIMLAPSGERTVLTYRGASQHYHLSHDHFHDTHADWFYVSSLSGDFRALSIIMHYAKDHGIKVAINPGKGELAHIDQLKKLLSYVNILSVNKEEMQQLYPGDTIREVLQHATRQIPVVIVTDGPKGVIASDGYQLYKAGMYEDVKVVDRLGAGDAFSSGFTAMIARGESMERAITFASANSTSVVTKIGAKTGILQAHARVHAMPIDVQPLH